VTRIPQLEEELVAAAARLQSPRRLLRPAMRASLAAAVLAVAIALAVVVAADNDNDNAGHRRVPPAGTPHIAPNLDHVDREAGVRFSLEGRVLTVRLLAFAPAKTLDKVNGRRIRATCGQGFTSIHALPQDDPLQTRTRLWPAGRATVRFRFPRDTSRVTRWCRLEDPVVGHVAFVKFSSSDATLSPEQEIERIGNTWAPLFAAAPYHKSCEEWDELHPYREVAAKYMAQPACEWTDCQRISGPIENCTPLSLRIQKSFADATVQDVVTKGRHRAAARFSNGVVVAFGAGWGKKQLDKRAPTWLIVKIGGNAGRGFFKFR
jgi:hypothetical protein